MWNLTLICFLSALVLFSAPIVAAVLSRRSEIPSIISFTFFLVLQQLLFAAAAALGCPYAWALLLGAVAVLVCGYRCRGVTRRCLSELADQTNESPPPRWVKSLPWAVALIVFVGYAAVRANYSYLNFNNNGNEVGVEKLFNLSLQQSFLFGTSYPPEWVWLSGERIRYYVFLKAIPGMAAWLARVLFGRADTGGVFFILSESFFAAMTPALLCGWILYFGRRAANQAAIAALALLLPCFCLVSTHFHALSLGLEALLRNHSLDWWSLSHQVIPFTENQYWAWFLMLGDNHAYMQVYFLQVLLWGGLLSVVLLEKFSPTSAACSGSIAAALVLSHPGSVLIDVVVGTAFLTAFILYAIRSRQPWRLKVCALNGAVAAAVAVSFLVVLFEPAGNVKAVGVSAGMTSPLIGFLNLNFSVLLWTVMILLYPLPGGSVLSKLRTAILASEGIVTGCAVTAVLLYLFDRSALALMVVMACLIFLCTVRQAGNVRQAIFGLFGVSAFAVWLLPEIVAFDHVLDSRRAWIRFQMSLRFWPEGYVLIPFALTLAALERIGDTRLSRSWVAAVVAVIVLGVLSHIPGISNRISRAPQPFSLDGFAEFGRRYPADGAIVSFLRDLPWGPKLVIAESCGIGDWRVPVDFAWPGRLAAFSGRTGICGWARHAMLYNNPLEQPGFRGMSVKDRTATFLKYYIGLFSHILAKDVQQAELDLMGLRALGVTHIVFGNFEKQLFPLFSLRMAAETLSLRIVFETVDGMGVLGLDGRR